MEDVEFAHQLSGWIDPSTIVKSGRRFVTDRERALAKVTFVVAPEGLNTERHSGLIDLALKYLSAFRIPIEVIDILRLTSKDVPNEAWNWLETLRFEGDAWINHGDERFARNAILVIKERDAVADLLIRPMALLGQLVSAMVAEVARFREKEIHLLPNWPGSLFSFVEMYVWAYTGQNVGVDSLDKTHVNLRDHAVTLIGTPPIDPKVMAAARDVANELARDNVRETLGTA